VWNTVLYEGFRTKREELQTSKIQLNEKKLFHGSKEAKEIALNGFNISHSTIGFLIP